MKHRNLHDFFAWARTLILGGAILCLPMISYAETEVVAPDEPMEELGEIQWLVSNPQPGVIFTMREYDDEALSWTADRLNYYIHLLRKADPKQRIVILAHGDEVASLTMEATEKYAKLHDLVQEWERQKITVHVCGSMAHMLGLTIESFPDYIDVVPFGPSQVQDYVELGYTHIELELTW